MSDNVKMFLRYGFSVIVAYGVGNGWFAVELGNEILETAMKVVEIVIALAPAVYAWRNIDNAPLPAPSA